MSKRASSMSYLLLKNPISLTNIPPQKDTWNFFLDFFIQRIIAIKVSNKTDSICIFMHQNHMLVY